MRWKTTNMDQDKLSPPSALYMLESFNISHSTGLCFDRIQVAVVLVASCSTRLFFVRWNASQAIRFWPEHIPHIVYFSTIYTLLIVRLLYENPLPGRSERVVHSFCQMGFFFGLAWRVGLRGYRKHTILHIATHPTTSPKLFIATSAQSARRLQDQHMKSRRMLNQLWQSRLPARSQWTH